MRTKEFIIEAIKKLLEKHTFENITVQNIIDEAGVSKPTFYRYFQSKYDLAASVFSESITKNMLMQYNGSNYDEFQIAVYGIIKENRKYLKKVLRNSGPESFYEFLKKYISEVYIQHGKERFGITEFSEEQLFKIDIGSNSWAYCIKKWIDEDCKTPVKTLIIWMKNATFSIEDLFENLTNSQNG